MSDNDIDDLVAEFARRFDSRRHTPRFASRYSARAFGGGPDGYIDNVDFQVTNEVIQPALRITVDRRYRRHHALEPDRQRGEPQELFDYLGVRRHSQPAKWHSIADNYDAGSPGPNQVDASPQLERS